MDDDATASGSAFTIDTVFTFTLRRADLPTARWMLCWPDDVFGLARIKLHGYLERAHDAKKYKKVT